MFNYKSCNEVILINYEIKGCVQTLLVVFWGCLRSWVKIIARDRCLSAYLGQTPVKKGYFD